MSLPRRYGFLEEHPHRRTLAGAGDLQRCRLCQLPTRAQNGPGARCCCHCQRRAATSSRPQQRLRKIVSFSSVDLGPLAAAASEIGAGSASECMESAIGLQRGSACRWTALRSRLPTATTSISTSRSRTSWTRRNPVDWPDRLCCDGSHEPSDLDVRRSVRRFRLGSLSAPFSGSGNGRPGSQVWFPQPGRRADARR